MDAPLVDEVKLPGRSVHVITCHHCPAQLGGHGTLEHHHDGSHTHHPGESS